MSAPSSAVGHPDQPAAGQTFRIRIKMSSVQGPEGTVCSRQQAANANCDQPEARKRTIRIKGSGAATKTAAIAALGGTETDSVALNTEARPEAAGFRVPTGLGQLTSPASDNPGMLDCAGGAGETENTGSLMTTSPLPAAGSKRRLLSVTTPRAAYNSLSVAEAPAADAADAAAHHRLLRRVDAGQRTASHAASTAGLQTSEVAPAASVAAPAAMAVASAQSGNNSERLQQERAAFWEPARGKPEYFDELDVKALVSVKSSGAFIEDQMYTTRSNDLGLYALGASQALGGQLLNLPKKDLAKMCNLLRVQYAFSRAYAVPPSNSNTVKVRQNCYFFCGQQAMSQADLERLRQTSSGGAMPADHQAIISKARKAADVVLQGIATRSIGLVEYECAQEAAQTLYEPVRQELMYHLLGYMRYKWRHVSNEVIYWRGLFGQMTKATGLAAAAATKHYWLPKGSIWQAYQLWLQANPAEAAFAAAVNAEDPEAKSKYEAALAPEKAARAAAAAEVRARAILNGQAQAAAKAAKDRIKAGWHGTVKQKFFGQILQKDHDLLAQLSQSLRQQERCQASRIENIFAEAQQSAQQHGLTLLLFPATACPSVCQDRHPAVLQLAAIVPASGDSRWKEGLAFTAYGTAAAVHPQLPADAVLSSKTVLRRAAVLVDDEGPEDACSDLHAEAAIESQVGLIAGLKWLLDKSSKTPVMWGPLLSTVVPLDVPPGPTLRQLARHTGITNMVQLQRLG